MRTIHIIAGTHGVGKTSLLGVLTGIEEYVPRIIDETEMTFLFQNNRAKAQEAILSILDEHIKWDLLLTLKTTRLDFLIPELHIAKEQGYRIRLQYIALSSMEDSNARIQNRVKKGGRDVAREEIVACFHSRWEDLAKVLPICNEVIFFDNDNGFDPIGRYETGRFIAEDRKLPLWWEEMMEFMDGAEHG